MKQGTWLRRKPFSPNARGMSVKAAPKPIASRGMKGAPATVEQKAWHDRLCQYGCVACRRDGIINLNVSVHHCDGRTKPHAHWFALPLCAGHHQDGTGAIGLIAIHPHKGRFTIRYGREIVLLRDLVVSLMADGQDVPLPVLSLITLPHV